MASSSLESNYPCVQGGIPSRYSYIPRLPPENVLREISERLSYHSDTGLLFWVLPKSTTQRPGDVAGSLKRTGYVVVGINVDAKPWQFSCHHVAWFLHYGSWPDHTIDHKDGDPSNNRIENLRRCTQTRNMANRKKHSNNSTGVVGVTWMKRINKYDVRVGRNKDRKYLGVFETLEEAREARLSAERDLHGEFAASARDQLPQT